jgi:hypothetical protein
MVSVSRSLRNNSGNLLVGLLLVVLVVVVYYCVTSDSEGFRVWSHQDYLEARARRGGFGKQVVRRPLGKLFKKVKKVKKQQKQKQKQKQQKQKKSPLFTKNSPLFTKKSPSRFGLVTPGTFLFK